MRGPRGNDDLQLTGRAAFDVMLTDLRLPGLSGLELVSLMYATQPRLPGGVSPMIRRESAGALVLASRARNSNGERWGFSPARENRLPDTASQAEDRRMPGR